MPGTNKSFDAYLKEHRAKKKVENKDAIKLGKAVNKKYAGVMNNQPGRSSGGFNGFAAHGGFMNYMRSIHRTLNYKYIFIYVGISIVMQMILGALGLGILSMLLSLLLMFFMFPMFRK